MSVPSIEVLNAIRALGLEHYDAAVCEALTAYGEPSPLLTVAQARSALEAAKFPLPAIVKVLGYIQERDAEKQAARMCLMGEDDAADPVATTLPAAPVRSVDLLLSFFYVCHFVTVCVSRVLCVRACVSVCYGQMSVVCELPCVLKRDTARHCECVSLCWQTVTVTVADVPTTSPGEPFTPLYSPAAVSALKDAIARVDAAHAEVEKVCLYSN